MAPFLCGFDEYLSGKDSLTQKRAALKEQLVTCETQLEAFRQQSLDAEEWHETASRMTGLPDDRIRAHLYDAVECVLVYDTETIEMSGSSTNRKSAPMKTSELRSDSDVSSKGKTVEFAPKIT